jgi:hypothetical protein
MPGIVFHFEPNATDVFSGRQQDLDAWIYAMKIPGDIDKAIVINTTGMDIRGLDRALQWTVLEQMPDLPGKAVWIGLPTNFNVTKPLWNFDHIIDWYVFGPAAGWGETVRDKFGVCVPQNDFNIALHGLHIAPTVMFDRFAKVGWKK